LRDKQQTKKNGQTARAADDIEPLRSQVLRKSFSCCDSGFWLADRMPHSKMQMAGPGIRPNTREGSCS